MSLSQGDGTQPVCIGRIVTFSQIPDAEGWLQDMAANGLILENICGHRFYFKKDAGQNLHYFLLNPDIGSNSEAWIYYEFLQMGGKRISYKGSSIMCPRLVLMVNAEARPDKVELYQYYYSYRNYRALHRLCRNMFITMFGVLACILFYLLQPADLWFPLQCGSICFLLCIYFAYSIVHYIRSCRRLGQSCRWKRPRRPDYEEK